MGEEKLQTELDVKIRMKIGDRHGHDIYNKALIGMKKDTVMTMVNSAISASCPKNDGTEINRSAPNSL
jgi:hypothetical protein